MTDSPTNPDTAPTAMKRPTSRLTKLCVIGLGAVVLSLVAPIYVHKLDFQLQRPVGVPPKTPSPECVPIELSGTLRRPSKWSPTLELVPAGRVRSFDIRGELLKGLPEGTHIRVKGVVRSSLHTGGTKENPSPFPPQWIIYLAVTELEVLDDPMVVLKRKREQDEAAPVSRHPPQGPQ